MSHCRLQAIAAASRRCKTRSGVHAPLRPGWLRCSSSSASLATSYCKGGPLAAIVSSSATSSRFCQLAAAPKNRRAVGSDRGWLDATVLTAQLAHNCHSSCQQLLAMCPQLMVMLAIPEQEHHRPRPKSHMAMLDRSVEASASLVAAGSGARRTTNCKQRHSSTTLCCAAACCGCVVAGVGADALICITKQASHCCPKALSGNTLPVSTSWDRTVEKVSSRGHPHAAG